MNTAEQSERLTLKPVRVVASVPEAWREGNGLLELDLPSGTRVRFPAGTDPSYLRTLAAALQRVISLPPSVRILMGTTPIDMRKSIDGLMAIVHEELREDAYSGHLFVFVSGRCDRGKILAWDKGGFVLFYKRLEEGKFKLSHMTPEAPAW